MIDCMMGDVVKALYFGGAEYPATIASIDGAMGIIILDWDDADPEGREVPHHQVFKTGAACMMPEPY
jgi:hypothetical protein